MSRTVRIGSCLSGELLLVDGSAVRRYRAGEAAEMLRDRCAAGSADADQLMALAASVGGFRGVPDTLEQAIELVAERVADGSIAVVTLEPEYGGAAGRSQSSGVYGEPDWDDIRPLSDLRETDPTITFGALSIELVDHTGIPFRNQELKLRRGDGGTDRIVLDDQGKWSTRSIEKTGTCRLVLPARLELTPEQLADGGPDGFQLTAGDLTVRREQPGELPLPRYDVHYRVVVDPPARTRTRSFPITSFASESAFPTAAIADLVSYAHELLDPDPSARIGLFGHTDTTDDADANKLLADRRADVAFALLTGDYPMFAAVAEAENWPLAHYQVMLRVLGCNPTAIDGEDGVQTERAIAAFREDYNADAWHDEGRARAHGDLPPGTALDAATKLAIVDAYHAELAGKLSPSRFLGPKRAGCGEFNPLGAKHADNRRVTLAIYGQDAPGEREFPCRAGDAGACQVDDAGRPGQPGASFRCKFYRERIHEENVESDATPFWDFEWLKTESGKAHLSALTNLPDTNEAEFVVQRFRPDALADDSGVGSAPVHGPALVQLTGLIRGGVAYALWPFPEGEHPFDVRRWFIAPDAKALLRDYLPYYFTVAAHGSWGLSDAPSYAVKSLSLSTADSRPALGLTSSGAVILAPSDALAEVERIRVTSLRLPGEQTGGFET